MHEIDLYTTNKNNSHYCYINNINRLLSRATGKGRARKFCRYCFRPFTTANAINKHVKYFSKHGAQHVEFPVGGSGEDLVEFDDFSKQMMVPFVVYCDMEAFSKKLDTVLPDPAISYTCVMSKFEACSYGYQVVCVDDRYTKPPVIYRVPDVAKHLIEKLLQEELRIQKILERIEPMRMSSTDELQFQNSTHCFICGDQFSHRTGKCDLQFPREIHDMMSDYPLAPETKPVSDDMLSPFSQKLWTKLNPKNGVQLEAKSRFKTSKLLCTLENKEHYVCHVKTCNYTSNWVRDSRN
ncbi:unnamed protein product [Mytilus coruscus]|uniref:C2H2-type domain-containing protein n=1 Tax=Mytilus coruscus TaxID=42192 RepID=A0A6J8AYT6_MYTCO|nr:unnamed protein product [Mytilus coruscus]